MKKIVIGTTEIEVKSLTPFVYSQGKGEKVLRIEVDATVATFDQLRTALEGTTDPVQYMEDDALVCEYVGYGVFEAQYKDGVYNVELHKKSLDEQMSALLVANEKLNRENFTLTQAAEALEAQNEKLTEQNELLDGTLSELLENVLPATLDSLTIKVMEHEERLLAVELRGEIATTETDGATEGEAVTE